MNADFRAKWSELLRQVWLGLENNANTSGSQPDRPGVRRAALRALKDMFNNRRRGGLLAREEFVYVTVLSWFHLTLQTDTPIVDDLKAEATSPADRLPCSRSGSGCARPLRSRELFELAEPMSSVLRAIELGTVRRPDAAAALFDDGTALAPGDARPDQPVAVGHRRAGQGAADRHSRRRWPPAAAGAVAGVRQRRRPQRGQARGRARAGPGGGGGQRPARLRVTR